MSRTAAAALAVAEELREARQKERKAEKAKAKAKLRVRQVVLPFCTGMRITCRALCEFVGVCVFKLKGNERFFSSASDVFFF